MGAAFDKFAENMELAERFPKGSGLRERLERHARLSYSVDLDAEREARGYAIAAYVIGAFWIPAVAVLCYAVVAKWF